MGAAGQADFLARWDTLVLPLVEADPQGCPEFRAATFLYREDGPGAPPEAVILAANALVDHRNPAATEFTPLSGSAATRAGLWALTLRMPQDWEASYRITSSPAGLPVPWRTAADRRTVRIAANAGGRDSRNPHVGAAMDGTPTSVLRLPGAPAAPWLAAPTPGHTGPVPRLQELWVPDTLAGRMRKVWLYAPPATGGSVQGLPLVLLHDGQVWARYQNLQATLDSAIRCGALPPVCVALIDSADVETRSRELSGPVGTVDFLGRDLLPVLRGRLPVSPRAEDTVVSGASYGGLAALWQVARYPDLIGKALAQSPSLWRYDLAAYLMPVKDRVRIRMQAGRYESTVHEPAAHLAQVLGEAGADVGFRSITGGHDWAWWSPWLIRGLAEVLEDGN
ncbi:alpha/beta hydrolase-fold protein [Arthrobacter sp. YD2]|uniref:alpha/beta hydrolase n=1 Tax=Arthrobacter sp. YD2 TaxID=3058046 RepID=UPI0025B3FD56|nr:alpha/beta hydrolase-fold protein [Arthrobacter sp. YD2]MDN3904954.1 alpha/beta hydrolase-fold protein [Arthrobacter sp. YD2]